MAQYRHYSELDSVIVAVDSVLKSLINPSSHRQPAKPYPAAVYPEAVLSDDEKRQVSSLMRVNHAGEVAAQALYKAQALALHDPHLKNIMRQSAEEELDHLIWCELRLNELDSRTSYLGVVWYMGSFGIGVIVSYLGVRWNTGFLAETEYQVVQHLETHLQRLPEYDQRSRAILQQMRTDELQHAITAEKLGADALPVAVKKLMSLTSKIMTKTAYWI